MGFTRQAVAVNPAQIGRDTYFEVSVNFNVENLKENFIILISILYLI